MIENLEMKAKAFAKTRHQGQKRWNGYTPYFVHLEDVNKILKSFKITRNNDLLLAAGWLHDTVEDTKTTLDEITKAFGEDVAYLVNEMTHSDDQTDEQYLAYVKNMTTNCMFVKLADLLANMTDTTSGLSNHFLVKRLSAIEIISSVLKERGIFKLE